MKNKHREAMRLFHDALVVKENGQKFIELTAKALELEKEVLMNLSQSDDRLTKSVIQLSIASLAYNLRDFKQVNDIISKAIFKDIPYQIFSDMLGLQLNRSQQEFAKAENPYTRALAPAGSGKTTTLLWRCLNDALVTGQKNKYLIFTFTRAARDELRDRVNTLNEFEPIRKLTRIETLNQWGNTYLKGIKDGLQLKTSKQDYYFLINNSLRPLWEDTPILQRIKKLNVYYNKIIEIFGEIKTLGFRHTFNDESVFFEKFEEHLKWLEVNNLTNYFIEKVYKPLIEFELIDQTTTDLLGILSPFLKFWKDSSNSLFGQALITLDDQKYWALMKLIEQYPDERLFPAPQRYQHILVDEFQDINPLDLFLIEKLQKLNRSNLTIVGDDDQAIYEWRASSPNFILKPENYFNNEFSTFILDINYRSPKNIVELSQKLIKNNTRRVDKNVLPFNMTDADIRIENFGNHVDSIQFINDLAAEYNTKTNGEKLAIISRKKGQLIPIQINLTSNDIEFYAKEDLNVLLSSAFNDLKKLLEVIPNKNTRSSTDKIVSDLLNFCNYVYRYPIKNIDKNKLKTYLHNRQPKTFTEALEFLGDYSWQIKSNDIDRLYNPILRIIESDTVAEAIEIIGEELDGLKKHYAKSDDDIFYKDPPFMFLIEYSERYGNRFWDFIDHIEAAIAKMSDYSMTSDETDLSIRRNVHLMTALRAKGKEFETVIILDVNDGIWPIKFAENEQQLEQERRLFYVALTRAKKTLIFITLDKMLDNKLEPCPYLKEMGLI